MPSRNFISIQTCLKWISGSRHHVQADIGMFVWTAEPPLQSWQVTFESFLLLYRNMLANMISNINLSIIWWYWCWHLQKESLVWVFYKEQSFWPLLPYFPFSLHPNPSFFPSFSSSLSLFSSLLYFSPYTFCLVLRQKNDFRYQTQKDK